MAPKKVAWAAKEGRGGGGGGGWGGRIELGLGWARRVGFGEVGGGWGLGWRGLGFGLEGVGGLRRVKVGGLHVEKEVWYDVKALGVMCITMLKGFGK